MQTFYVIFSETKQLEDWVGLKPQPAGPHVTNKNGRNAT